MVSVTSILHHLCLSIPNRNLERCRNMRKNSYSNKLPPYLQPFLPLLQEYTHPKGTLIRNNIAYSILMALAPLVALLTILSLHILKTTKWLYDFLILFIPSHLVTSMLQVGLQSSTYGFLPFVVTLGFAYYTASRGFYAIMLAFCSYDEETIRKHHLAITLQSLLAPLLFITLVFLIIFLHIIISFWFPTLSFLTSSLLSLLLYFILSLHFFYTISYPKRPLRFLLPGSLFFAFGLTIMGFLFFFYIHTFTHYTDIYGSIASIMILLLSTRLISMLMHMGACINYVLQQQRQNKNDSS